MTEHLADALKFALDQGYTFPTLTPDDKRQLADELTEHAKRLRLEAHWQRPLPPVWKVGMRIRYISQSDFGWDKGDVGVILRLREEYRGKPAADYQVFYTNHTGEDHPTYWTTPDDVEWIPEEDDG